MASIAELLLKTQLIDERQHDAVMSRTRSLVGGHIVQQVAEMGYATEGTVARAISIELGLPRIDLAMTPPEAQAVALLDARTCSDRFVLPVALRENGELLWLAMADPTDQDSLAIVRRRTAKRVRPAVAGPSEILRAVKTLYPNPGNVKTGPIEVEREDSNETFEVVNVGEDIKPTGAALKKLADQLGVDVPPQLPSQAHKSGSRKPAELTFEALEPRPEPGTDPRIRAIRTLSYEQLFTPVTTPAPIASDDLAEGDLHALEALRASMEKGALILRALAELCVEKKLFTRAEMKKQNAAK